MTVEETLRDLVAIDSVSANSNSEIISYLARRCEAAGFACKKFAYIDETGVEKFNLVARSAVADSAGEDTIELVLVGHTDTVPYDPAWIEALHLTEKDGELLGRGACDT